MKVHNLRQVVQRTSQEIGARLPAMVQRAAGKSIQQLNAPERIMLRTDRLRDLVLRPSKSEQERILGSNDLVDLNFLERGCFAARAVCRVILRDASRRQIGVATGFMVSSRLLMTNHHVLPSASDAATALAQFDYTLDLNGVERRGPSFRVRPDEFYHADPALDFAVVAVDPTPEDAAHANEPLGSFGALRLSPIIGKINVGEFISIVQHPSGLPKQVALRENRLLSIESDFLVYQSDTAQGSSGSPLFNDSWQVVGLHSAGVPRKNANGEWLTRSGQVVDENTEDSDVDWIGNRGARASRIVAALKRLGSDALLQEVVEQAESMDVTIATSSSATRPTDAREPRTASTTSSSIRVTTTTGTAQIDLPAGFSASIERTGPPRPTTPAGPPRPTVDAPVSDAAEAYKSPVIDTRYSNRNGFDETFLSVRVPLPKVTKETLAARMDDNEYVVPYEHFSIVMHKKRRLAIYTACNVDARETARQPDSSKAYTRAALGGLSKNDVEKWVAEPRLAPEYQLPDAFFLKDRKAFDKGHIVRRDDVVWGRTYAQVRRANGDTFHVTNCSPQVAAFNQSSKGGEWGLLENMILRRAKGEKIVIFAGPVFDDAKDREFRGEDDNGEELIVQIPSRFWKIVVADGPQGLESYGFVLAQDLRSVAWEFDIDAEWVSELHPLTDIQKLVKLVAFPANVVAADMYGRVNADESLAGLEAMKTKGAGARPPRQPN
ncbi:MAG: DNA/RNA non-specific endonuclease [Gemmatimonadaceae bacterium]|nr:DNA/RNA non-specific endonuclease [Gemmatimonadaceae bacterium]